MARVAPPSETPGARLKETVTAGNCPWWGMDSGVCAPVGGLGRLGERQWVAGVLGAAAVRPDLRRRLACRGADRAVLLALGAELQGRVARSVGAMLVVAAVRDVRVGGRQSNAEY